MKPTGQNTTRNSFRIASLQDALFVASCLRTFYKRDGNEYGIAYDHASCLDTTADILTRGICVIGPKSSAGAYLVPWPFNRSVIVAQVLFWFFADSHEISIYDHLCDVCEANGATHVNVASIFPKGAGKQFYQKRGLKLVETHYLGRIKGLQDRR